MFLIIIKVIHYAFFAIIKLKKSLPTFLRMMYYPMLYKETKGGTMKPKIEDAKFGSVTIDSEVYEHDVVIRLSGVVEKRKKKLSKQRYGPSHTISLEEAKHILDEGAKHLIIGTGQSGMLKLSDEAEKYFRENGCSVVLLPTLQAVKVWNETKGKTIGMFHVTC